MTFTKPCGCAVVALDDTMEVVELNYCPLHEAAKDMFAALELLVKWLEDVDAPDELVPFLSDTVDKALAKAGKRKEVPPNEP